MFPPRVTVIVFASAEPCSRITNAACCSTWPEPRYFVGLSGVGLKCDRGAFVRHNKEARRRSALLVRRQLPWCLALDYRRHLRGPLRGHGAAVARKDVLGAQVERAPVAEGVGSAGDARHQH